MGISSIPSGANYMQIFLDGYVRDRPGQGPIALSNVKISNIPYPDSIQMSNTEFHVNFGCSGPYDYPAKAGEFASTDFSIQNYNGGGSYDDYPLPVEFTIRVDFYATKPCGLNSDRVLQGGLITSQIVDVRGNIPGGKSGSGPGGTGEGDGSSGSGKGNKGTGSGGGSSAGSSATKQSNDPNALPSSSSQGDSKQTKLEPSPFFDGKEYQPGSDPDTLGSSSARVGKRLVTGWYVIPTLIVLTGGAGVGYWWWRRHRK